MRKTSILMLAVCFMVLPAILFPQEEHKPIVEEVSVNWWQVPVFAVDEEGNPVNDLEPGDIEIIMNERVIPDFSLDKRSFNVTERSREVAGGGPAAAGQPPARNKVVFLLFDQVLSDESAIGRAKIIAQKIVTEAEPNTRFAVMAIDAFAGLVYIGEGTGNEKDRLSNMIKNQVKVKENARLANIAEIASDLNSVGGGISKYESGDMPLFSEAMSKSFKRKSMGFFYAFETLYFYLNAIEDNKFVYLFSEGMSNAVLGGKGRGLTGERGAYNFYLERVAQYLSRCGAVLFVINPMGVLQTTAYNDILASDSIISGENFLSDLVKESGGTYLEGAQEKIAEQLTNIHQAYYEVSFPDSPQLKGNTREITIDSKRKGIIIHTLRSLEKRKSYTDMIPIEKEMLVLNLVTQPDNSLVRGRISPYNARITKTKKSKKGIEYSVTLPPGYLNKTIEMYKVFLAIDSQGVAQVEKIEKESLYPKKNQLDIQFQPGKDDKADKDKKAKETGEEKEAKEAGTGETRTYFVLVNGTVDPARALVHGISYYDEDPELEELEKAKTAKKTKGGKSIEPQEMQRILQGAADYCERLKQSAFHFYCREKIVETRLPLTEADMNNPNIDEEAMRKGVVRTQDEIRTKAYTQVKSYEFGYRLIKQGSNIKEERDYINSSEEYEVSGDEVINTNAFFSQKAIFAPINLLDRSRQENYDFQFVEFDEYEGRRVAVVEAQPKDPSKVQGVYGTIRIDMEDFSVMKIEANPQSMRGYDKLKEFSEKLKTKLYLSLESEFGVARDGIRFPTKVRMLEKYKGGPYITEHRGQKGWERTRTEFDYTDYQFFDVETEVKVEK